MDGSPAGVPNEVSRHAINKSISTDVASEVRSTNAPWSVYSLGVSHPAMEILKLHVPLLRW